MISGKGTKRLGKVAREFNVGISTMIEFLNKKGHQVEPNPNAKIDDAMYSLLQKEYSSDIDLKKESEKLNIRTHRHQKNETLTIDDLSAEENDDDELSDDEKDDDNVVFIKDHSAKKSVKIADEPAKKVEEIKTETPKQGVKVVGKIDISGKSKTTPQTPEIEKTEAPAPKSEKKVVPASDKTEHKADKTTIEQPAEKQKPAEVKATETKPEKTASSAKKFQKEEPAKKAEKPIEKTAEEIIKPTAKNEEKAPSAKEDKPTKTDDNEIKTKIPKVENDVKVIGRIDLSNINQLTRPPKKTKKQREEERKARQTQNKTSDNKGTENTDNKNTDPKRRKRKRIKKERVDLNKGATQPAANANTNASKNKNTRNIKRKRPIHKEVSEVDVQKQVKDTLARLTNKSKSKGSKYRRDKRAAISEKMASEQEKLQKEQNTLKVTEFVSVNELANMMEADVTKVIATCMSLGMFVSINQRLDAETLSLVAEEFGYKVEFISADVMDAIEEVEDSEESLEPRPPIVTVMGHVDHGKTSLLDHIRKTNVIAGEAGGITQHIGAYNVELSDGRKITFLDTPGHEAFTAMRARGAQVTDIAIIIVAADDSVMPQTVEAINHASAAGVPIVFAINKIDKPGANPEAIKEKLANMNYMVEEWGGKYQSHDISAKNGIGIEELMEKVLLEAEMLDLKANPNRKAIGSIIESSLDRGRGYVATVLVETGTLHEGDILLAGQYMGHVKAMFNERNQRIKEAGPAEPALILGLNGAPQAGDKFNVMETEREARQIANKREQLQREQGMRTQKHITLDEIGRRIAIGNFQELNVIIKGDVDGSIEALADSLIKLSTEEIQVNVKHKAVGQISESDVMLASASDAIIIGFQVRPSLAARKLAEQEQIDIRLYSIIYDAIEELKSAMEGMLSPEIKEEITGTAEVQEVYKITKVGTIAGSIVRDGKIVRNNKARVIRDGIVIYTGDLGSLKRFKEDAKEVKSGYECGINVANFNDVKVGDTIESFTTVEVAKKL
ncbi:MAG: translation initiation factor IF-2 [Prolixibacteraceae bacterium]|nr:translation initiation factor IF-2 [Prolixibacteraceae bacterium]MBN2648179.1 translation initiation factor IF-2 [Prolixibacteraceae bacterium]